MMLSRASSSTMVYAVRARSRDVRTNAKKKSAKDKARKAERAAENKKELESLTKKNRESVADGEDDDDDDAVAAPAPTMGKSAPYESTDIVMHTLALGGSYKAKTGEKLLRGNVLVHEAASALFNAPFVCASHDAEDTFNYGNKAALALWELDWDGFVGMKSTKSADVEDATTQAERRALLDKAASDGLITNYSGVRMSSTGKKFRVENATVWTMTNGDGVKTGQAVRFEKVVRLNADGSDGDAMVVNENGEWVKDVVAPSAEDEVVDVDAVKALVAELSAQVEAQAAVVRELKDNGGTNADDDVKAAVSVLLDVKAKLSEAEAKLA
jgi:hypothetical protein